MCVQVCRCADFSYHLFPCDDSTQPPTLRYKQTLLTCDTHDAMSLTEHTQTRIIEEHWTKKHTQNKVNKLPFILTAPALQCFQESDVAAQVE